MEEKTLDQKEHRKICGVSFWRILGYIVIYSFIGFLVEVLYGLVSKGVIESRQSFIYGPFCAIYGVGAVLMILPLKKINTTKKFINFGLSALIGCALEYVVSLFGDKVMHVKWWDYSTYFMNINGRTCLYFGIFWGILGYLLITKVNPRIDDMINKFKEKIPRAKQNTFVIIVNVLLVADMACTIAALDFYQTRVIIENNINVQSDLKEHYVKHYDDVYGNPIIKERILKIWGNDVMIKTFPNLKIDDADGNTIYLNSYYPAIQNYYFKVFDSETFNINDVKKRIENAREIADKPLESIY
ncbi:MAG: putative ABC transporter permease [Clostridia bacterium]|nr:putative ABC transporter permease [Clostridia bacterium]